jgi:endonuclease I
MRLSKPAHNTFNNLSAIILGITLSIALPLGALANNKQTYEVQASVGNYTTNPSTYYNSVSGLTGNSLLFGLHDLMINTHQNYTVYDDSGSNGYQAYTDRDPDNSSNIITFYAHASISSNWSLSVYDREHVWPQSLSNDLYGTSNAGADMHHIRPTIKNINNTRSSKEFGNVGSSYSTITYGSGNLVSKYTSTIFEPHDDAKGDTARIIMYMYVHYNSSQALGNGTTVEPRTTTLPITNVIAGANAAEAWDLLLDWNELDPVDVLETNRNDQVAVYQGNRNPFIDHPEYADLIWGTSTAPSSLSISPSSTNINVGKTTSLTVTASPAGTSNSVTWSSNNTSVATVSNGVVTGVSAGNATITATSTINTNVKATCSITVSSVSVSSITIKTPATETIFALGSLFNSTGLVITATYSDTTTQDISSGFSVSGINTDELGQQTATISYEGKTTTYLVNVTNNGASVSSGSGGSATDLFISEYVEGSSNNKAIEIFNGTGGSISLISYKILVFANGATTPTNTISLSGTLENNATYVLAHSSSTAALLALADSSSGLLTPNGNDAVVLQKSGSNIDVVGTIGSSTIFAENVTLVRKSSVSSPTTTYSSSEWDSYSSDTFSYLGAHSFAGGSSGDITASEQAIAWAQYFLNTTGPTCLAMTGDFSSYWTNLADEYGYMVIEAKDIFVENAESDATIANAKARYEYIVQKYGMANFVTDGSGAKMIPTEVTNHISKENDLMVIIAIITIFSGTSVCAALLLRNKKRSSLH